MMNPGKCIDESPATTHREDMTKFSGDLPAFKALIASAGYAGGKWSEIGTGGNQYRASDGAIVCWWPSTGKMTFQGPVDSKTQMQRRIDAAIAGQANNTGASARRRNIFVVHGHDSVALDQLELALRRLGLEPFILMNTTGGGETIIEALEGRIGRDYTSDFGIALFTPDDFGYAQAEDAEKGEPRARQNVVLETGMLLASLTRKRMAILVKGHVDLPSDLQGVIQFRFNTQVREIMPKLCARLREVGVELDEKKIGEACG